MLVEFQLRNFTSFNQKQSLSMVASSATKEDLEASNTIGVNKIGIERLLKSAAIFGANASGKSNLVQGLQVFRSIVLRSLSSTESNELDKATPFMFKSSIEREPSEFEISIILNGVLMRYGLASLEGKIVEEWLFWNNNKRETELFHRTGQTLKFNASSFSEAKDFIEKQPDGTRTVAKTRDNVPFISVLAQFDAPVSSLLINWFQSIGIISGLMEFGYQKYTMNLFETDKSFKSWALNILKCLQIDDVYITEANVELPKEVVKALNLGELATKKQKKIELLKQLPNGDSQIMPLEMESDGTTKIIYLLGPLFDVIFGSNLLIIDEFDSKLHSLMSSFLIGLFHQPEGGSGQVILTTQDTNLMSNSLFRRDQIWFTEKNSAHESELFSLLEYKDHYARRNDHYERDYLQGKYGAIPLFDCYAAFEDAVNG